VLCVLLGCKLHPCGLGTHPGELRGGDGTYQSQAPMRLCRSNEAGPAPFVNCGGWRVTTRRAGSNVGVACCMQCACTHAIQFCEPFPRIDYKASIRDIAIVLHYTALG
jgi:hypothetical protein